MKARATTRLVAVLTLVLATALTPNGAQADHNPPMEAAVTGVGQACLGCSSWETWDWSRGLRSQSQLSGTGSGLFRFSSGGNPGQPPCIVSVGSHSGEPVSCAWSVGGSLGPAAGVGPACEHFSGNGTGSLTVAFPTGPVVYDINSFAWDDVVTNAAPTRVPGDGFVQYSSTLRVYGTYRRGGVGWSRALHGVVHLSGGPVSECHAGGTQESFHMAASLTLL